MIILELLTIFKFAWHFRAIIPFFEGWGIWRVETFLAALRLSDFLLNIALLQLFLQLLFHFILYSIYEFLIIKLIFFVIIRLLNELFLSLLFIFLDIIRYHWLLKITFTYLFWEWVLLYWASALILVHTVIRVWLVQLRISK